MSPVSVADPVGCQSRTTSYKVRPRVRTRRARRPVGWWTDRAAVDGRGSEAEVKGVSGTVSKKDLRREWAKGWTEDAGEVWRLGRV